MNGSPNQFPTGTPVAERPNGGRPLATAITFRNFPPGAHSRGGVLSPQVQRVQPSPETVTAGKTALVAFRGCSPHEPADQTVKPTDPGNAVPAQARESLNAPDSSKWHWSLRSMEIHCGALCVECGERVPSQGLVCEECELERMYD